MAFNRPTLAELDERIRNDIASRIRVDNATRSGALLRRATVFVLARVFAGACHLLYAFLDWLATQRFIHSMDAEFLEAKGMQYDIPRKAAQKGAGTILAYGSKEGAVIPEGSICQRADGLQLVTCEEGIITAGVAVVRVESITHAAEANTEEGTSLTFIRSIPDVHAGCVVSTGGIVDGMDAEPLEEYRERVLERLRNPPHGGAKHDYEVWAKEVPGVTRAWCLPLWMGLGTVGVMFVRDHDGNIFPTEEQCQVVRQHIEPVRPVTASEFYVFSPAKVLVDVTLKIWPDNKKTRAAVVAEIADFVIREGAPEGTLNVSRLSEAISMAVGEHHHDLILPINDVVIPKNGLPAAGKIVFIQHEETDLS